MKSLESYMKISYPIQLSPVQEKEILYWRAWYPDLPGCESFGDTPEEALSAAEDSREVWIETAIEEGISIPTPTAEKSGKLLLRIPPDLHEQLAAQATQRDISLNTYIIYLLSSNMLTAENKEMLEDIVDKVESLIESTVDHPCLNQEDDWAESTRTSRDIITLIESTKNHNDY